MANVPLLERVGKELVEPKLKPFLFLAKGYLPQAWVFRTETGPATLTVGKNGSCMGEAGEVPGPDVIVEWSDIQLNAALTVALTNGDRSSVPANPPPKTSTLTPKGKTAFGLLRGQIGL